MENIFIVIATQVYEGKSSSRAFVEKTQYAANKCRRDLINGGWFNVEIKEVDRVVVGLLNISSNY